MHVDSTKVAATNASLSDEKEEHIQDDDDVTQMSVYQVLAERDAAFNKAIYDASTTRQKSYTLKVSLAAPGRSQPNYERDSVVRGLGGIVGLCFDVEHEFKSQPDALDKALAIFRSSRMLGHLPEVLPTLFGTSALTKTFQRLLMKKRNAFKKPLDVIVKDETADDAGVEMSSTEPQVCCYKLLNKVTLFLYMSLFLFLPLSFFLSLSLSLSL